MKLSAASDVWAETSIPIHKWWCMENFFSCLWNELLNRLLFKELEEVVVISQRIWYRRNNFVFSCHFKSPNRVTKEAKTAREKYKQAQVIVTNCKNAFCRVPREAKWKKLRERIIKTNWDVAFCPKSRKARFGIVVRDSKGEIITACCKNKENVASPKIVKILCI